MNVPRKALKYFVQKPPLRSEKLYQRLANLVFAVNINVTQEIGKRFPKS